ncbi:hypothetical protein MIMGU_mgv1a0201843mg, partial [Erythranthe guttata]
LFISPLSLYHGENVQAMKKQCVGSSSDSKKP